MAEVSKRKVGGVTLFGLWELLESWRTDLLRSEEQAEYFRGFDVAHSLRHMENAATKRACIAELEALIEANESKPRLETLSESEQK